MTRRATERNNIISLYIMYILSTLGKPSVGYNMPCRTGYHQSNNYYHSLLMAYLGYSESATQGGSISTLYIMYILFHAV